MNSRASRWLHTADAADESIAVMEGPKQLVPAIREMIAKYQAEKDSGA